jgi:hypothetical protein
MLSTTLRRFQNGDGILSRQGDQVIRRCQSLLLPVDRLAWKGHERGSTQSAVQRFQLIVGPAQHAQRCLTARDSRTSCLPPTGCPVNLLTLAHVCILVMLTAPSSDQEVEYVAVESAVGGTYL